MSHRQYLRAVEAFIGGELAKYGIRRYSTHFTKAGHLIIGFHNKANEPCALTISRGKTEDQYRVILRKMMEEQK